MLRSADCPCEDTSLPCCCCDTFICDVDMLAFGGSLAWAFLTFCSFWRSAAASSEVSAQPWQPKVDHMLTLANATLSCVTQSQQLESQDDQQDRDMASDTSQMSSSIGSQLNRDRSSTCFLCLLLIPTIYYFLQPFCGLLHIHLSRGIWVDALITADGIRRYQATQGSGCSCKEGLLGVAEGACCIVMHRAVAHPS